MAKFYNKKKGQFKSQLEHKIWTSMPKKRGVKVSYETERIPYRTPGYYLPDFVVCFPEGRKLYIEVKGWFRAEDKRKMAAVKQCNPDLDIRMVFPSHNKRNERWCAKHNYPYAIGSVPRTWFKYAPSSDT